MPHQEIPWKQIYDLSLQCCKYRSTKSFSVSLLREMNRLVPFDEAVVFYLNGNLKITDYYLYNINPKWMSLYLGYYSNADRGAYGLVQRDLDNLDGVYVHQWSFEQSGEVIPDYIRPRNLVSTLGFPMRDATDRIRTIFALDRLSDAPYQPSPAVQISICPPPFFAWWICQLFRHPGSKVTFARKSPLSGLVSGFRYDCPMKYLA